MGNTILAILVEKGILKPATLTKYNTTENHIKDFLSWKHIFQGILAKELRFDLDFF